MTLNMAGAGFFILAALGFGFLGLTVPDFGGLFSLAGVVMVWAAFANMDAADDP